MRNSTDDTVFYRWTGWDKELTNIRQDTTFTATYYQGNRYRSDTWRNGSFEKVIIDMKAATKVGSTASIAETVYKFITTKCSVPFSQIETLRQTLINE